MEPKRAVRTQSKAVAVASNEGPPSLKELARRRGLHAMARWCYKHGLQFEDALQRLLGVAPIPVLTDVVQLGGAEHGRDDEGRRHWNGLIARWLAEIGAERAVLHQRSTRRDDPGATAERQATAARA